MMAHEPIPYVLADPADDVDHGLHPVDSATRTCCGGIGGHGPDCRVRMAPPRPAAVAEMLRDIRDLVHTAHRLLEAMPGTADEYTYAAINVLTDAITAVTE